eukprot:COSAG02_NODE_909_length_16018_cov_15.571895_14_plen_72_part_00
MNVLELSDDGAELRLVQTVEFPTGTLMPTCHALNASGTRLLFRKKKDCNAGYHDILFDEYHAMRPAQLDSE